MIDALDHRSKRTFTDLLNNLEPITDLVSLL